MSKILLSAQLLRECGAAQSVVTLIAGLGNPGRSYENTYHNIGLLFIDSFHGAASSASAWKQNARSTFFYATADVVTLVKSALFMNKSGGAVADAAEYFHRAPENILIVHDDADIPVGAAKLSRARGAGGHKGVASVVSALGTTSFYRLRIGIRGREMPVSGAHRIAAGDIALTQIRADDREIYSLLFSSLISALMVNDTPSAD